MNLIVTDQCNRSCPYCFAKNKLAAAGETPSSSKGNHHISLDKVDAYLAFLSRSNIRQFKILGGEPTLHPDIGKMVDTALGRGFSVAIFTNALWPASVKSYFSEHRDRRITFVANINEPDSHTRREFEQQQEALHIAGARARLSFNLYKIDFDLRFAIDLIDRHKLQREIRVGLASPIAGACNDHIPTGDLKKVGKRLAEQFRMLESNDILGYLDCGFQLCMFDESDLASLALCSKGGFASHCGGVIDVDHELNVWHCFPLSKIGNVRLSDFQNKDELNDYYNHLFDPLRSIGCMDECVSCKYLKRGQCKGGCLGRTITAIQASGDPDLMGKLGLGPVEGERL